MIAWQMMLERRLSLLGLLALFIFIFFSRGLPNALFPHVPMLQSTSGPRVMTTILADSPERRRKELVKVEQHDRKLPVVDSTTVNPGSFLFLSFDPLPRFDKGSLSSIAHAD